MQTAFTKYEGAGNDFILIDARDNNISLGSKLIARLCDRHFGIGADGLMTLRRSAEGECAMRYFNADGSEGEMCGNGGRCFALFAEHLGIGGTTKVFSAVDGLHTARLLRNDNHSATVELGMIDVKQIVEGDGSWWSLNTGVPHYVEFVQEVAGADLCRRGRAIRYDTCRFSQGTNVNFVEVTAVGKIRVRTYERGVECETLACGTGATAAAIITNYMLQHETTKYEVTVPGGVLFIAFDHQPSSQLYTNIRLSGDARRVFEGVLNTENFQ